MLLLIDTKKDINFAKLGEEMRQSGINFNMTYDKENQKLTIDSDNSNAEMVYTAHQK